MNINRAPWKEASYQNHGIYEQRILIEINGVDRSIVHEQPYHLGQATRMSVSYHACEHAPKMQLARWKELTKGSAYMTMAIKSHCTFYSRIIQPDVT